MLPEHLHPAMAELETPQIAAWAEANKPRVAWIIGVFDQALANTRFLAGDSFSVADITAAIATDFMKIARLSIPDEATNFKRWYDEVRARPSYTA